MSHKYCGNGKQRSETDQPVEAKLDRVKSFQVAAEMGMQMRLGDLVKANGDIEIKDYIVTGLMMQSNGFVMVHVEVDENV